MDFGTEVALHRLVEGRLLMPLLAAALACAVMSPSPADGCEPGAACAAAIETGSPHSDQREVPTVKIATRHRLGVGELPLLTSLDNPLFAIPEVGEPDEDEGRVRMPWIWRELRRTAYHHLPQKQLDRVHATFAPCVVSSGFDTVAGAGVHGSF